MGSHNLITTCENVRQMKMENPQNKSLDIPLDAGEFQLEIGCGPSKFWTLIRDGEIPEAYYVGRHLRIPRIAVANFRKRHAIGGKK